MAKLGKLKKVELRDIWENEAGDFTPWLAEEENLALLGETIGIELELEAQEKTVGSFSADILCRNTADSSMVLIENQLEKTDHTHLGQVFTYAAGLDAVTIIWIAERFREEHRAAVDWLNEISDERFSFFGLEVELWKIGDSVSAPKFNIVCKPNDWSKSIKETSSHTEPTETGRLRLEFWTGFREYLADNNSFIRTTKPNHYNSVGHALGKTDVYMLSVLSVFNSQTNSYDSGELRVELVMCSKNLSKVHYEKLFAQKDDIEEKLGFAFEWYCRENQITCGAVIRKTVDYKNKSIWPECYEWLKEHLEKMHSVLSPLAKKL